MPSSGGYSVPPLARSTSAFSNGAIALAAGLIVLVTAAAFGSSFAGAFVFDDEFAITNNPTIRQLWPIWKPLWPPRHGETVTGRPLLNLSLAINYAISGYGVWSYHAANLAIHLVGALLLFGILRRTFLLPTMRDRWGAAALPLALVVALLWAIHPLQTESVTYIVQRAESLVGLFYLLTLYCFLRGAGSARGVYWYVGSVLACLLGLASKEVMISAPLVVLLYDRTFCAGSFREAWRRRYGFYLALAGTWLLLGWLVLSMSTLGTAIGPGSQQFTWWSYLLTQPGVIVHYLRLAVWPSELCLDYGWAPASTVAEVLLPATVVAGLFAATVWALLKRSAWGLLGVWFFAILAPTSSFVPIGQAAFEHRMYLPLAAVTSGLVVGGFLAGQWLARRGVIPLLALQATGGLLVMFASITFGFLTFQRSVNYQSELSIWEDTVAKAPSNARAHYNLGTVLAKLQRLDETVAHFNKALELNPDYADAHNNLATILAHIGRGDEAIVHYRKALQINPDFAEAHYNLGTFLANCGRLDEAIAHFQKALEIKPDAAEAGNNLGVARSQREGILKALDHQRELLRSRPDDVALLNDTAWVLATNPNTSIRNGAEATELAQRAVRLSAGREPAVLNTLAAACAEAGRFCEAVQTAHKALELATQQNNQSVAESLKAKIPLYETGIPFRRCRSPLLPVQPGLDGQRTLVTTVQGTILFLSP